MSALKSLIASGTKLWLDSVDPQLVQENFAAGATGATSNPAIISDLIKTGRFDAQMVQLMQAGSDDESIAWALADQLVADAQAVFLPIWESTQGNDGYVSFELNPLIEDPQLNLPHAERVSQYVSLGKQWSTGHKNRMIKIPATPAGIEAATALTAAGVTLNVTLIFSMDQYEQARDAVWAGAQMRDSLNEFKSVFSIFVSRLDVYTQTHASSLSDAAQGQVGIVNAKRIWQANQEFWAKHATPLQQEIIFASTGTKDPNLDPWKYVAAFAGSDIETNPPKTNSLSDASGQTFDRQVDVFPADEILAEIDEIVDFQDLEKVLMEEGIRKFAEPQNALLALIAERRQELATA
jgi:transaldolase